MVADLFLIPNQTLKVALSRRFLSDCNFCVIFYKAQYAAFKQRSETVRVRFFDCNQINNMTTQQLPSIPVDVIENKIVPLAAINFLFVAKRYYAHALESIINNATDINRLFGRALAYKNLLAVRIILQNAQVDVSYNNNEALQTAVDVDFLEAIQLLIQDTRFDSHRTPRDQYGDVPILCYCIMHGSIMALKLLLSCPMIDPSEYYNRAVCEAVFCDDTQKLQLLMADPRVDPSIPIDFNPEHNSSGHYPSIYNNEALRMAIKYGKLPFVKLLLSDPRVAQDRYWSKLTLAVYEGQIEIVEYLLADGKTTVANDLYDILNEHAGNRGDARLMKALSKFPRE